MKALIKYLCGQGGLFWFFFLVALKSNILPFTFSTCSKNFNYLDPVFILGFPKKRHAEAWEPLRIKHRHLKVDLDFAVIS